MNEFFMNAGHGGDWLKVAALCPPPHLVEGLAQQGFWGLCDGKNIALDAELEEHPAMAAAVYVHEISHFLLGDPDHGAVMYGLAAGLARRAGINGEPISGVFPTNTPEARAIERRVAVADNVLTEVRKIVFAHRAKILLAQGWPFLVAGPAAAFFIFHHVF